MITLLLLGIIYLSFISLGLPDSLLGSGWPSMYQQLNVPLHYAGFISMIVAGGTVIASIFSERMIRRLGTGIVTVVSVVMTAAALIGFSFAQGFIAVCFFAIPLGLGAGSVDAALNNYVALHYTARHMSWLHCFWGVGASIGPIIMASFLTNTHAWNGGYRTIGIIQLCLAVFLFISLPLWKKITTTDAARHNAFKFTELLSLAGVKYALIAFFCYCSIEIITGLWGASFLVMVKKIAPEIAARWTALYYIGITSGRFISGLVTITVNNRQMIRWGQVIIGGGIIVLILPLGNNIVLPGFFLIGLGCAPIFPSLLHETPRNFGEEYSQAIMGIQMASAYIGTTVMPPVFGRLASFTGFALFPFFIGILLIVKIMMIELLNRKIDSIRRTAR